MRPPEQFVTARCVLRFPTLSDADPIFTGYAQDPELTTYLVWKPHARAEQTRDYLAYCIACWQSGERYTWVITPRSADIPIGMIACKIQGHCMSDIGFVLQRQHWGQGIMPEVLAALVAWGLAQPSIFRIWTVCDVENRASARVLEKVGLSREGVLRRWVTHPNISDEPRDCYCYALVK